jgi:hypothetical protein
MNDHSPCSATASGTPAPPGVQPSALSLQPSAPQRSLDLKLDSDASGRTRPISCLANASFQLSRVRYDDPGEPALAVFTLPHLGGVLAGDRGELCCALGRDAAARVRRAVATQVLGMPEARGPLTRPPAWSRQPARMAGRAADPVRQRQLHPDDPHHTRPAAHLALLDILAPGRLARVSKSTTRPAGSCWPNAHGSNQLASLGRPWRVWPNPGRH